MWARAGHLASEGPVPGSEEGKTLRQRAGRTEEEICRPTDVPWVSDGGGTEPQATVLVGENGGYWEEPRAACTRTRLAGQARTPWRSQVPRGNGQAVEDVGTAGSHGRGLCASPHLLPQWGR